MADPQVLQDLAELIADARAIADANVSAGVVAEVAPPLPGLSAGAVDGLPVADGVGAAGLSAIRADLGDCRRCALCEGRRKLVYGAGDPDADLMVIGEVPDFQSDQAGEPIVGEAGEMLDKMLRHVLGLGRPQVFVADVVKCRPPDNRRPLPDEVQTCLPFLQRQIAAVRPRILLVMGPLGFQAMFGTDEGIDRARGRWREWEGIPAMPTFHPSYLLNKPQHKRLTFDDLKQVRARYDAVGGRR